VQDKATQLQPPKAGPSGRAVGAIPELAVIPDEPCCNTTYLRRLVSWRVHRIELLQWEERFRREGLKGERGANCKLGELVTRYLCWRRAVFQGAGIFWLISLSIQAVTLFVSIENYLTGIDQGFVFGVFLGPYSKHFELYIALEYAARSVIIISGYLAVFFAFIAAFWWRRFRRSRVPAFASYMLGYSTPFLVYLLFSPLSVVNLEEIQQHVCRDILAGTYREPGWVPGQILRSLGGDTAKVVGKLLSDTKISEVASQLPPVSEAFGLPPSLCDSDPDTWADQIGRIFEEKGRLARADGVACAAATEYRGRQTLAEEGLAPDVSRNITDLEAQAPMMCNDGTCLDCKSAQCLRYIPALERRRAGVGTLEERAQDFQTVSEHYADLQCNKCDVAQGLWTTPTGRVSAWACNTICVDFWLKEDNWNGDDAAEAAAVAAAAAIKSNYDRRSALDSAFSAAAILDWCIDPDQVETLRFLTNVAVSEWPWRMILSLRSTFQAFVALMPYLLSLMSGTITGAVVAKIVIPYSRIPALVLTCAISYSLPYISLLTILFKQSVGETGLLPSAFFGIMALLVFMPWQSMFGIRLGSIRDITEPQEHVEAQKSLTLRLTLHYTAITAFMVGLFVFLSQWFELLQQLALSQLVGLEAETLRDLLVSRDFWRRYGAAFLATLFNMFGFSKIAGVTFADCVLWAVVRVDEAKVDVQQELQQEEQTLALFAELHRGLLLREPRVAVQFDRIYREMWEQKSQTMEATMRSAREAYPLYGRLASMATVMWGGNAKQPPPPTATE